MEKLLVIVGPTGVGKTNLSIQLAQNFQGEIISGDSMQVYKKMNIGTAKITKEEMQDIPHFLVDCFDMDEEYHVKKFQEYARKYINEIIQRKHLPIICGGTGLYIKSVIYDYSFIDTQRDDEFVSYLRTLSNDELYGLLKIVDKESAVQLHPNNRQRLVRAICMAHDGTKKSDILDQQEHILQYDVKIIGLTMNRDDLYKRINLRVDQMMKSGLFEEIDALIKLYPNIWDMQCFKGIGYKEWKGYYDGTQTKEECVEAIKKNSRNFAKRQYTWFNNQMSVHWYDIEEDDYLLKIREDIEQWLNM